MRLFFALWPPAATARALAQWANEAQRRTGGRITDEAKIHLTLAFLGEADPARAIRAAQGIRGSIHSLPIEHARCWRDSGIVWVGPRETPPALSDLFAQLKKSLLEENIGLEKRPFAAHVTLIRKARAASNLPALPAVDWPVSEFVLVRSALSASGPAYEPLERFALS